MLSLSEATTSLSIITLSKSEWETGPLAKSPNSVHNVSPFIDLGNLIPSAFFMATDMSFDSKLRHNRIGLLAISPSSILVDSGHPLNDWLGTVTDLGDQVIGALREEEDAGGALSRMIPETTLSFLGR